MPPEICPTFFSLLLTVGLYLLEIIHVLYPSWEVLILRSILSRTLIPFGIHSVLDYTSILIYLQNVRLKFVITMHVRTIFISWSKSAYQCPDVLTNRDITLAGLTCAMYMREDARIPNPDPQSGLFIRDRLGSIVKVHPDHGSHFGLRCNSFITA